MNYPWQPQPNFHTKPFYDATPASHAKKMPGLSDWRYWIVKWLPCASKPGELIR